MRHWLERLRHCRRGATVVEYGMVAALICLGLVVMIGNIGTKTASMWGKVSNSFTAPR